MKNPGAGPGFRGGGELRMYELHRGVVVAVDFVHVLHIRV